MAKFIEVHIALAGHSTCLDIPEVLHINTDYIVSYTPMSVSAPLPENNDETIDVDGSEIYLSVDLPYGDLPYDSKCLEVLETPEQLTKQIRGEL